MPLIVFVHGALSTDKSFTYIAQNLGLVGAKYFNYDIRTHTGHSIAANLLKAINGWLLKLKSKHVTFIAHSYGGVISVDVARALIKHGTPCNVISMSTPYAGSSAASFLKFLKPSSKFFDNIGRYNNYMRSFSAKPLPCRVKGIVSTAGRAEWINEDNDGVVSVKSQLHYEADPNWSGAKVDVNHFEVLLSPKPVALIQKELLRIKS